ncbi:MAG TPA: XRE family transcriptional regulator [Conexibacter sp.]|nr:XRE family transcriptional regulator [Conexibacter sp.]
MKSRKEEGRAVSRSGAAFEQWFDEQMEDPEFRDAYERAGAKIRSTVQLMRALDLLREQVGLSKAEVARRMGRKPEAVSRLLRSGSSNPTLETLVELVTALDLQLELRITRRPRNAPLDRPHVTFSARL